MIKTVAPVTHHGLTVWGGAAASPDGRCCWPSESNCWTDPCSFIKNLGDQGVAAQQFASNMGDSLVQTSKAFDEFGKSGVKIAQFLPAAVVLIVLGLAIGLSKGHRFIPR